MAPGNRSLARHPRLEPGGKGLSCAGKSMAGRRLQQARDLQGLASDPAVSCAFAAKILCLGANSRYMQQNGSKTLDVVGQAGPVSLFSASAKPCVTGMVICPLLA